MELEESRQSWNLLSKLRAELNSAHEAQRSAESNIDELNEEIKSFESDISAVTDAKSMLESDLEKLETVADAIRLLARGTKTVRFCTV